ncbi:MAG: FecR domain-containing protein [Candidatus Pseudomonas phytovorans]|uniref:FecR domain-containing protein n=1 Tax=Candidatus Pseudomonas phytovorans TaxID=3121377 RepID=A0AAJ5WDJ1_9PSED|nr:FecR domain-containing protein [Pseudomonas sp.]WEK28351.1 MAG: FecR domain-containing protein [Pseudomonas sp.]
MAQPIDPLILGEAADWLVQLQSGTASEDDQRAVQAWCQRSAQHAQAWQRAEAILGDFRRLPTPVTGETLRRLSRNGAVSRRQALHRLGLWLLATPAAWLAWRETPWQQWTADARTAVGEQRALTLADGSQVLLNTDTAIDITFDARQRRIDLLAGEILLTSAKDPATPARPLLVRTLHGQATALGTRFSVRIDGGLTRVAVLEGAVDTRPLHAGGLLLKAGERSAFDADRVLPASTLETGDLAWEHGMLLARDMRLADLLLELGRYRPGVLRCHPAVRELKVSGAFPLADTDASLRLLSDTLPVNIQGMTRYWVTVEPQA